MSSPSRPCCPSSRPKAAWWCDLSPRSPWTPCAPPRTLTRCSPTGEPWRSEHQSRYVTMEGASGRREGMGYNSIAWLPLALGLTILGLVLSYLTYRRRGLRPAMMGTAWSLLPIAAYLTGAIEMLWKVGAAIGQFGTGFVFSPMKWAGIGVTGLAVALFLAAGGRHRRRASREARRT